MLALAALAVVVAQDPDLAAVQANEARRVATMAKVAPAVCSVMGMNEPGGGSGVIIDPAGFVLTNYHVVGEPDTAKVAPVPPKDAPGPPDPDEPPPDAGSVLPEPPPAPPAVLEQWQREHPGASDAERQKFVADWQAEWREEHLPKGKHQWRNKKVGLPDGQLYEAVVLGIDPGSDLALLRLLPKTPGQRWPSCALGDSDQLLVGETVFAMGNPFLLATDFTPTVTFGIVSGTHRYQEGAGNRMLVYPDCIQVDAPVNPGNSGGPLFNERGEVVGINGRISIGDRGRVNVGVGFAIASNQIANFLADLLAGRHAEHGTLDMSALYMTAPRETTRRRGVFAQQMFKDSVAAAAGVALGDEITMFNGEPVRSANQLATRVGVLPAGAWITLGFRPALGEGGYGEERIVSIRLASLDTGSSADKKVDVDRLASRANRRIATAALLQRLPTPAAPAAAELALRAPDGTRMQWRRRGQQLRIDVGDSWFVRGAAGEAFKVVAGKATEPSADERAWLEREFAANPCLWPGAARRDELQDALLVGGVHVLGQPAYRFALPGDGERETWLFADGTPAGYALRDPVRRARIERHLRGGDVRTIVDGKLEPGWTIDATGAGRLEDDLFARPR